MSKTCECKYATTCMTPRMKPTGGFDKGILFLGEAPGKREDEYRENGFCGRQFIGGSGKIIRDAVGRAGLKDPDILWHNVMRCRPPDNKFPERFEEIEPCLVYLDKLIRKLKPKVIVAVGGKALAALFPEMENIKNATITKIRGCTIPHRGYNCWVVPIIHPATFLHNPKEKDFYLGQMQRDIARARDAAGVEFGVVEERPKFTILSTAGQVARLVLPDSGFAKRSDIVGFDYETTGLSHKDDRLLSVALYNGNQAVSIPLHNEEIKAAFREWLLCPSRKIVTEINMEVLWSWSGLGIVPVNIWRDTEVMTHIADQRLGCNSLEWRAFTDFGVHYKDMVDREHMGDEDIGIVLEYNAYDAYWTWHLWNKYEKQIAEQGQTGALELLSRAAYVYSQISCDGIKIDEGVLDEVGNEFEDRRTKLIVSLKGQSCVQEWNRVVDIINSGRYPDRVKKNNRLEDRPDKRMKLTKWTPTGKISRECVLFDILKAPILEKTPKGAPKMDKIVVENLLSSVEDGALKFYLTDLQEVSRLKGIVDSYKNLKKNLWDDGRIHPVFPMNIVTTYRSSSRRPNLQNQHKHGEGVALRKAFVPTHDCFVAADYGAMEIRIIALQSQDKILLEQLNKGFDLHSYWAAKLFKIPFSKFMREVKSGNKKYKEMRHTAKNGFVFPTFYGSWFGSIAHDLHKPEWFIQQLQAEFYGIYTGVAKWHKALMVQYKEEQGLYLLNGFFIPGPLKETDIFNYPIQGPASHYLAASCIDLHDVYKERGFESFLCGQIHDDVITDTKKGEVREIVKIKKEIMETPRFGLSGCDLIAEFSIGIKNWYSMREIG